jgi:hypothetical protein
MAFPCVCVYDELVYSLHFHLSSLVPFLFKKFKNSIFIYIQKVDQPYSSSLFFSLTLPSC